MFIQIDIQKLPLKSDGYCKTGKANIEATVCISSTTDTKNLPAAADPRLSQPVTIYCAGKGDIHSSSQGAQVLSWAPANFRKVW